MILSLFESYGIGKSAYVNACLFNSDNQSPRWPKTIFTSDYFFWFDLKVSDFRAVKISYRTCNFERMVMKSVLVALWGYSHIKKNGGAR